MNRRAQDTVFETRRPDEYLDRLAASRVGRAYKAILVDALALGGGETVVDLGCGPGADLPGLSAAVGPAGHVIGVDNDAEAVDSARRRLRGDARVEVLRGDLQELDLAPASVDRVRTDRVLQHVVDPAGALREVTRVLRSGGRGVFAEPDWATLVVDHPDATASRRYTDYVVEHVVRNACVGRQLPRLAQQAGLLVDEVIPFTAVFDDVVTADRVLGFHRVTQGGLEAGSFSASEAEGWLQHLEHGPFFAAVTAFVVVASKP
jgi:ubiquinone/menaquinone biosynthesis C-methylase UbiE